MQCNFLKHPIISFDSYKAYPNPISMFIFRENSGLQLVIETIGRGDSQKAGQRVNPSSPEPYSCPAFLVGHALHQHHGAPGRPRPHTSQWPSCPPSDSGQVPLPQLSLHRARYPHLSDGSTGSPDSPGMYRGWGRSPGATDTPSAASSCLLQTFCPG